MSECSAGEERDALLDHIARLERHIARGRNLEKVSRVVVITDQGIKYEGYNIYADGVELHIQDDGYTLKIFPRSK